jgi:glycosyltransferase involved in cell wall biosynthesis
VIPNGVDAAAFVAADGREIRMRYGLGDATIVGFTGSLKAWHGVNVLLKALFYVPQQVRVLIVGDGPERHRLERIAAAPGLNGRVVFTGAVPHSMVPDHVSAMDIAVAPYIFQEGFYFSPLKVGEYLAAGRAVVASAEGDFPLVVGDAGILVPPGDVAALSKALRRLSAEPELRRGLAEAAALRGGDLDWAGVAARVEGVLQSLAVPA